VAGSILVVDDDIDLRGFLVDVLGARGEVDAVGEPEAAVERVRTSELDLVITDVRLGEHSGIELCRRLVELRPDVPVIVMTAFGSMDIAVDAIRAGAYDFVTKPLNLDALMFAVDRAIRHRQLGSEIRRLRDREVDRRIPGVVGESPAARELHDLIDRVAHTDATVLITGESGTGKEVVARAIHQHSRRAQAPFAAINCAAVPAQLLESELFGHVRGAFTDARRDRQGLFVQAGAGTLFLDEIGEMAPEMQAKLLRALQERRVRPIGADNEVAFQARIIAATNIDLEHAVEQGSFREDLYYRINVVHIAVPPLRARTADILPLADFFLRRNAERTGKPVVALNRPAAQKLLDYPWPGNVRELENCIERAIALTDRSEIGVDDLPARVRDHQGTRVVIDGIAPEEMLPLAEVERRYIRRVLEVCQGNKSQAARVLGLDRRTFYRRLESLDIREP
jgi:two-component system response regulator HydG